MKAWIKDMLTSKSGTASSKRVISLLIVLVQCLALLISCFTGVSVNQYLVESLMYIAIAAIGGTAVEKFNKFRSAREENTSTTNTPTHETPLE